MFYLNCLLNRKVLNSFLTCGDFCLLLITFQNSLDPDQDRENVGDRMWIQTIDTLRVFLKDVFEKK